jgi:hypothetical protein
MPELTRRRCPEARDECWHIYYGDVHAGTLAIRTGNPHDTDPRERRRGFYPGYHPGECSSGTSASFEEARADFEVAWQVFLSTRTEEDFQAWRDQREWTARKYALWDAGKRLDPPSYGPGKPCSRFMKCPCGLTFDMLGPAQVVRQVLHISLMEAARVPGPIDDNWVRTRSYSAGNTGICVRGRTQYGAVGPMEHSSSDLRPWKAFDGK